MCQLTCLPSVVYIYMYISCVCPLVHLSVWGFIKYLTWLYRPVPKFNRKIVESETISIPLTHIWLTLLSWHRHFNKKWRVYWISIAFTYKPGATRGRFKIFLVTCLMIILWHVWDRVSKLSYRNWLYIWVTWRVSYKKQELLTLCELPSSSRLFSGVCVAHLLIFVLSDYATLRSYFRYDYCIKTMFGSCLPPVVCIQWTLMSYLGHFCLLAHSGVFLCLYYGKQ